MFFVLIIVIDFGFNLYSKLFKNWSFSIDNIVRRKYAKEEEVGRLQSIFSSINLFIVVSYENRLNIVSSENMLIIQQLLCILCEIFNQTSFKHFIFFRKNLSCLLTQAEVLYLPFKKGVKNFSWAQADVDLQADNSTAVILSDFLALKFWLTVRDVIFIL